MPALTLFTRIGSSAKPSTTIAAIATQLRYASSSSSSASEYIPGRKGYAPGFAPPEGSRKDIKPTKKRRDLGTSLPSHLENAKKNVEQQTTSTTSPKKLYRQALTEARHKHAHELLALHGQRELIKREKIASNRDKEHEIQNRRLAEKEQQKKHEAEVVEMLHLDTLSQKAHDNRQIQKENNRKEWEAEKSQERCKRILALYKHSNTFVTLENLDEVVDNVLKQDGMSVHSSYEELMSNTVMGQSEIEERKRLLKEAMGLEA
ncbi:hypothetical protein BDF20DRAFT_862639 [Mycotypha africana]|uniref:uncharacterized protein n=1 Tax=Mycotypha africana TaxID=64632 RepID=UPI00230081E2|nr:uncharacterized protein BDF20DRAFT_862639 [Mycotypha africana]KAI8981678.1 hypothetical protein BDF20DRAFT_862639 [Mycotypha africana]